MDVDSVECLSLPDSSSSGAGAGGGGVGWGGA
ncbi:hypothetical protein EE612_001304 [Oryza sativa]|nr:hypothetical protein EE612_001304 [Oryza sativa]